MVVLPLGIDVARQRNCTLHECCRGRTNELGPYVIAEAPDHFVKAILRWPVAGEAVGLGQSVPGILAYRRRSKDRLRRVHCVLCFKRRSQTLRVGVASSRIQCLATTSTCIAQSVMRGSKMSKISFALLALHRGGRVVIDESALALRETAAAQFGNDGFDGGRI